MAAASQYLKLDPNEIALFDRLFSLVEDPNTGSATGPQVSGLFLTSGLPRPTLAAIWNIASAGKGGKLDKDGFFIGCRLIAIAQQNLPVSQEALLLHRDVPLPVFHGGIQQYYSRDPPSAGFPVHGGVPQYQQQQQQQQQQQLQQSGPIPSVMPGRLLGQTANGSPMMPVLPSMPPMISSMAVTPNTMIPSENPPQHHSAVLKQIPQIVSTSHQIRTLPANPVLVQQPTPIMDTSTISVPSASDALKNAPTQIIGMSSAADSRRQSIQSDSLWEISSEKRETYLKYFDQADADKDGFVNGKEAKTFFTMSKLSSAVLRDIWLLSDIDQDNRLNKEEFTIAMHLTMAVRMSSIPVPAQLPEPLMQYYNRQMQLQSSSSSAPTYVSAPANATGPNHAASPTPRLVEATTQPSSSFVHSVSASPETPAVSSNSSQPNPTNADRFTEKAEYTRQIASAKAQIEEQKIAIQGYQSRLPDYEEELQHLKVEARTAEETLTSLTSERKLHQAAFEKIRSEIATAKSNMESFSEKINEERKSINEFQERVALGTKKLEELHLERDQLQKSVDELKQQVQDKELAVVCLEQQMEDVRKQISHLTEVSSYQMQILSKVTSDHEDKEKQLADLFASKAKLDHVKAAASAIAAPAAIAPISPLKNIGSAEPVWIAPSLANDPLVSSLPGAIVQEEFSFPEFSDDDFTSSSLKSVPIVTANTEKPRSSVIVTEQFTALPDSIAQQALFPIDAGSSAFNWNNELDKNLGKVNSNSSPHRLEANPFEEDDWNPSTKTLSTSPPTSEKQHSASSQTQNMDSMAWPASDFGAHALATNGDWAQF